MWLLSTTDLTLHCFLGSVPSYSILSHTWEDEEVTHQEMLNPTDEVRRKAGYRKISACAARSLDMGYKYTWVDTCCIDKSSSAELTEAINSMFSWYKDSRMCLVYLQDYQPTLSLPKMSDIGPCRWFTRGWTLQEIIAPLHATFYSADWRVIGNKTDDVDTLSKLLAIDSIYLGYLCRYQLANASTKMSWAANRKTTKPEDMAYCLMGLFNVNMPLLYGEGDKAFMRLQEEIIKSSDDTSIFMWRDLDRSFAICGPLARSPRDFSKTQLFDTESLVDTSSREPFEMTNKGLRFTAHICSVKEMRAEFVDEGYRERFTKIKYEEGCYADRLYLAVLSRLSGETTCAWFIRPLDEDGRHFGRAYSGTLILLNSNFYDSLFQTKTIYMKQEPRTKGVLLPFQRYSITTLSTSDQDGISKLMSCMANAGIVRNEDHHWLEFDTGAPPSALCWIGLGITHIGPETSALRKSVWLFVRPHAEKSSLECVVLDGAIEDKLHQLQDSSQLNALLDEESRIVSFEIAADDKTSLHELGLFGDDYIICLTVQWYQTLLTSTTIMNLYFNVLLSPVQIN
ncbi:hypothetical protein ACHAQA_004599 [Verticillium albo-atrum]